MAKKYKKSTFAHFNIKHPISPKQHLAVVKKNLFPATFCGLLMLSLQ